MNEKEKEKTLPDRPVIAMYDVRGIQNYIYRTSKVKDARGASAIVNDIIRDALEYAVDVGKNKNGINSITSDLIWYDSDGVVSYAEKECRDVQVLFIGGGNATVLYRNRELCIRMNKRMSKYVLDHTYSLQLAVAITDKTDSYSEDYKRLQNTMVQTKANMSDTKPLGTLPVMRMELKTGYPIEEVKKINDKDEALGRETWLKKQKADMLNHDSENKKIEKRFDKYITQKGVDSNLAVVHIDGNNMGMRIRNLIENEQDYVTAINKMRHISYNIDHSYRSVFDDMAYHFNNNSVIQGKEDNNFVLKILTAGDDITYVCNARIALDTVKYFCEKIVRCTMNKGVDDSIEEEESVKKYGFSVCAGIAYCTSHFPFSIAYDVAEDCCSLAKKYANEQKEGTRVANYVDFQVCRNIQAQNVKQIRKKEYMTATGEQLMLRPYYVDLTEQGAYSIFEEKIPENRKLSSLIYNIKYFNNNIPRNFAKELRNTYADGEQPVKVFADFLESRNYKMPDDTNDMYFYEQKVPAARWYDALELMDYGYYKEAEGVDGDE